MGAAGAPGPPRGARRRRGGGPRPGRPRPSPAPAVGRGPWAGQCALRCAHRPAVRVECHPSGWLSSMSKPFVPCPPTVSAVAAGG
ncbi:hypothetical protein FCI23_10940 [Actinacidiphila oryziradicis]|uniref:Uncharacterized protein n=1 Tax=Actinacidiphila oryziradicis TaxID=2571141 RepID=A0A4V5N2V4_9ACTN|nr:hypothetical protein FCI23_10940 [Actinacidiphila oryziradicis]